MSVALIVGDKNVEAVLDTLQRHCAGYNRWCRPPESEKRKFYEPLLAYSAAAKELLVVDVEEEPPRYRDIVTVHEAYLKKHPDIVMAKDHFPDKFLFGEKSMK
jgi:hypothetical protein